MDELWEPYVKWNISATELQMVYDYTQKLMLSGLCQNLEGGGIKECCLSDIGFLLQGEKSSGD